jgi:hypothetical protein
MILFIDGDYIDQIVYEATGLPVNIPTVLGSGLVGKIDTFAYYYQALSETYVNRIHNRIPSWSEPVEYHTTVSNNKVLGSLLVI